MGIPVYRVITDHLLQAINAGKLKPGDRIASIRELSAEYHVSQITVLRVFKELARTGKIVRRDGLGYYVKGAEKVLSEIERVLGVKADSNPTPDGLFSISALRCVGACGLAPVMVVNGKVYGKVTPAKAVEVIKEYQAKESAGHE